MLPLAAIQLAEFAMLYICPKPIPINSKSCYFIRFKLLVSKKPQDCLRDVLNEYRMQKNIMFNSETGNKTYQLGNIGHICYKPIFFKTADILHTSNTWQQKFRNGKSQYVLTDWHVTLLYAAFHMHGIVSFLLTPLID